MDSMILCYSLLNMKVICLYMVSTPLPITVGEKGGGGDVIWKFAKILWWQIFFWHLCQNKSLWVELKTKGGVIFATILLHFYYFISLETANTQKSEVSFKNFFRKCQCISCYLPMSSHLQFQFLKIIFRNSVSVFI